MRDVLRGDAPDVASSQAIIAKVDPDVLLLVGFDYDASGAALAAFAEGLSSIGVQYRYRLAPAPNSGIPAGRDIDGDGSESGPRDTQGYGRFRGAGGLALISRYPIDLVEDFTTLPWDRLPGSQAGDEGADEGQRLSSVGHWVARVDLPDGSVAEIGAFHATPPVFDGPEDRNGRRNHDEIRFWELYLAGTLGQRDPDTPFLLMGDANLDPIDGEGRHAAIARLLDHPELQDPEPRSEGGFAAADPDHLGDPALDTVDWPDSAPGNLRVSYLLPGRHWDIVATGVHWPQSRRGETDGVTRHRLVWADLVLRRAQQGDIDRGFPEVGH